MAMGGGGVLVGPATFMLCIFCVNLHLVQADLFIVQPVGLATVLKTELINV
jgi:hypothetical protein